MRLFLVDLSEGHHHLYKLFYGILSKRFDVLGIITKDIYNNLESPRWYRGIVLGTHRSEYKGKPVFDKVKVAIRDRVSSMSMITLLSLLDIPRKDDIFIFTTSEPFATRYFESSIWLYRKLYPIANRVVLGVHKSFWLFDDTELSSADREKIANSFLRGKRHVWLRYTLTKKFVDSKKFKYVFTLGEIRVPKVYDRVILYDRFYEDRLMLWRREKVFTVVVPGRTNSQLRDTNLLVKVIELISNRSLFPIRFVFLGNIDKELSGHLGNICKGSDRCEIVTFDTFISEEEYTKWLSKAHLIWVPLRKDTLYGDFSVTGAVGDSIYAAVPILLPEFYPFAYAEHYTSVEELVRHILRYGKMFVNCDAYTSLRKHLISEYSKQFSYNHLEELLWKRVFAIAR